MTTSVVVVGTQSPLPQATLVAVTVVGLSGVLPQAPNSGLTPIVGASAQKVVGSTNVPQAPNSGFLPIVGAIAGGMKLGGAGGAGGNVIAFAI